MKSWFLSAVAAICLLSAPSAEAQDGPQRLSTLTVTGQGEAIATPDLATVRLGVSAQNKEGGAAMREVNRIAEAIMVRLDSLGVAEADRQTSEFSLGPIYRQRQADQIEDRIAGFMAHSLLTVRVRDLDTLGDVLTAVLEDGANRFNGLSFGLQDPYPVMQAARRDAVADAMARAELYAEGAGVELGDILSISERGPSRSPMPEMATMSRAADSAPVAAGEARFTAFVTMEFSLKQ